MKQPEFNTDRGKSLAEAGLSLAVETAEKEFPDWGKRCWALFEKWISKKPVGFEFLLESFRQDCYKWNMIERPRSDRAFGMVSKMAVKRGMIKSNGTKKVSNILAHSANAALWIKL